MTRLPLVFALTTLAGCDLGGVPTLARACDEAKVNTVFPAPGAIAYLDISFDLLTDGNRFEFTDRAICDYQGSSCLTGEWLEIWYGDKSVSRDIAFADSETLQIWHHGLCINVGDYKKHCEAPSCSPEDFFEFPMTLAPSRVEDRRQYCANLPSDSVTSDVDEVTNCWFPEKDLVSLSELAATGYPIENVKIRYSDAEDQPQ